MESKSINKVIVEAKVIRANGDIEDLGVISEFERKENWFQKIIRRIKSWLT